MNNSISLCKGVDVFLNSSKRFLLENCCDVVCLLVNADFERGKCIGTGFCFVYYVNGVKKSVDFDEVYEGDAHEVVDECFAPLNSGMHSISGRLWDFIVIKLYNNGKVCINFFYNMPPGSDMRYDFPV